MNPLSAEARLARIETRLVQLMLHMGLNPYEKAYDTQRQATTPKRSFLGKFLPSWR